MNILQSLQLIKAGKLRALGVTTPQRSPIAPEIPAIAEAGLKGYDMTTGTVGRARRNLARRHSQAERRDWPHPEASELTSRLADDGMTVVASTPEQFAAFLARETDKFAKVIEAAESKAPFEGRDK